MVGVGPPALRLELLSLIVSEQTLPGGGGSLAGDEGGV